MTDERKGRRKGRGRGERKGEEEEEEVEEDEGGGREGRGRKWEGGEERDELMVAYVETMRTRDGKRNESNENISLVVGLVRGARNVMPLEAYPGER